MKLLSVTKAVTRLKHIISNFKSEISNYEIPAKSCLTCETKGACCLDAHFVNVRISRLEAAAINNAIKAMAAESVKAVTGRIDTAITEYGLTEDINTRQTFACPLFEKGIGCLVHDSGKPLPCIAHACYEHAADLPPDILLAKRESQVDRLNTQTYGRPQAWLPLPLALQRYR